jgi:pimeloyl-ACP methyl ester carboxylesterase
MRRGMVIDAVRIADRADMLDADVHLPENAWGLVIFAHGSGSSRFSSRNGASTGAAAALMAAAERPKAAAVVSRGGRPDLAGDALPLVRTATLLIVGGDDGPVIEMNEAAMRRMRAPVELAIVPHATHLFEEPGTLEEVQRLALDWLTRHMRR